MESNGRGALPKLSRKKAIMGPPTNDIISPSILKTLRRHKWGRKPKLFQTHQAEVTYLGFHLQKNVLRNLNFKSSEPCYSASGFSPGYERGSMILIIVIRESGLNTNQGLPGYPASLYLVSGRMSNSGLVWHNFSHKKSPLQELLE